jgi:NAD+ synthetase
MRVAVAQIDTTIGDFGGNLTLIRDAYARAASEGADLLMLPELALCGYPPMDLLERPSFLRDQEQALRELIALSETSATAIVSGAIVSAPGGRAKPIWNAAVLAEAGELRHVQPKTLLPTYDVFDESRYFRPGDRRTPFEFRGTRIGLTICEDVWSGEFWGDRRPYPVDPVQELVEAGAELILTVSASPWHQRKIHLREAMLCDAARRNRVPIVFCNLTGGNDELIFDGASFAVCRDGTVTRRLAAFEEDFAVLDPGARSPAPEAGRDDAVLLEAGLMLGIRDYFRKLGLRGAVIGLSGGVDSAVTAHLAARALGPEQVLGVLMPGPFSSDHSVTDALRLAGNLGIETRTVRIDGIYKSFLEEFRTLLGPAESYGLTQENLQARIRGTLLMAVSNHEGRIVLATGNKSELSMGYTTLYGDLVGGLAVLGDVLKRDVYALARGANAKGERVPWNTIQKPPSAELAPDQRDTDSLPPYDVLDAILGQAIEEGRAGPEIRAPEGAERETVRWVLHTLDRNEYKRRQAPLVLRVSEKAFGTGRRVPIVQRAGWGE